MPWNAGKALWEAVPPKVLVRSFRKSPLLLAKLARNLPLGVLVTLSEKQPLGISKTNRNVFTTGTKDRQIH